jgi:hypothetical protein
MKTKTQLLAAALAVAFQAGTAQAVTFTSDTVIGPGNFNYDGQDIVVIGCTLTVNGLLHSVHSLTLTNGAVLTHDYAPNGESNNWLNLAITGDMTVGAISRVDVTGRGYGSNRGQGNAFATGHYVGVNSTNAAPPFPMS